MNSFLLLILTGCLTVSSVTSGAPGSTSAALGLSGSKPALQNMHMDALGVLGPVQMAMLDGLDDDDYVKGQHHQIQEQAINDQEAQCPSLKPGRLPLVNFMKEQLQLATSDSLKGRLMALALSAMKIFLKKTLEPYDTATQGIIFTVLDRAIPTKGTAIEQLLTAGKGGSEGLTVALLDQIKKAIETGSLDSLLKGN